MSGSYANPFTWEQVKKGPFCDCWRFRFIPRPSPACAAQTSQKTTTKQHPTRPRRARWTEEAPHPLRVDGDDRGEPDVATTGALVGPLAQRRHRRIGVSQPAGERQVGGGGRGGPRRRRGRGRCSSADVVVFETLRRTGSLLRGTRNGGEDAASPPRGRRRSGRAGRGDNGGATLRRTGSILRGTVGRTPPLLRAGGDDRGDPDVATTGAVVGPIARRGRRRTLTAKGMRPEPLPGVGGGGGGKNRARRSRLEIPPDNVGGGDHGRDEARRRPPPIDKHCGFHAGE